MRTGKNPLRHTDLTPRSNVVVAAIVHLPDLETPYHATRLDIIKLSLIGMRDMSGVQGCQVVVWSNGSCAEINDWLVEVFQPDTLIISPNVGKSSARRALFSMFPPDTIIALADDDMFYYPDWLVPQLALLQALPKPAQVTGYPTREACRWASRQKFNITGQLVHDLPGVRVERGDFIPDQWTSEYAESVELSDEGTQLLFAPNDDNLETLVTFGDHRFYLGSHHCQFVARAGAILPVLEWNNMATTPELFFDLAADQAGILRVATTDRLTKHMGNILDDQLRTDAVHCGYDEIEELKHLLPFEGSRIMSHHA